MGNNPVSHTDPYGGWYGDSWGEDFIQDVIQEHGVDYDMWEVFGNMLPVVVIPMPNLPVSIDAWEQWWEMNEQDFFIDIGDAVGDAMTGSYISVGGIATAIAYKGQYHKSNEIWHVFDGKTNGKTNWMHRWSKTKHAPPRSKWHMGAGVAKSRANQAAKVSKFKAAGKIDNRVGGVLVVADVMLSGELKPSHAYNSMMIGLSLSGVGSLVAGGIFIADLVYMGYNYSTTGEVKGFGDVMDEKFGSIELYEGAY